MRDWSQTGFVTTPLDPAVLRTPYARETRWHVITGTICCGKTTLINRLADLGYRTAPEVARGYVERELAKGRTLGEIRQDRAAFCRKVKDLTLDFEPGLPAQTPIFFDRALPDCLSFYRFAGLDPNEILHECFRNRYASVFHLDPFEYEEDGVRVEGDVASLFLDEWVRRDYEALGYTVVRVPVLPTEERLAFVLEALRAQGAGSLHAPGGLRA
jgi:predicted ATPase